MQSEQVSSFFVTLLSKCSLNYFPENSLSKFGVKLPHTLNLSRGNWLVGIKRFASTSINDTIYWPAQIGRNEKNIIIFKDCNVNECNSSIIQILHAFPSFIETIKSDNHFFDMYELNELSYDEVDSMSKKYIKLATRQGFTKFPVNYVFTPRGLFDHYLSEIHPDERINEVNWIKKEIQEWEMVASRANDKFFNEFKVFVGYPKPLNYLCLYSDIIHGSIIGDFSSNIMYMLPIEDENSWKSRRRVIDIDNIEYHKVSKKEISEINILIADEMGEQIDFTNDYFSTMVLLHFKKDI